MPAVDYWVPARASPVEPGSLGRDDSPPAIALPFQGDVLGACCSLSSSITSPRSIT